MSVKSVCTVMLAFVLAGNVSKANLNAGLCAKVAENALVAAVTALMEEVIDPDTSIAYTMSYVTGSADVHAPPFHIPSMQPLQSLSTPSQASLPCSAWGIALPSHSDHPPVEHTCTPGIQGGSIDS